MCRERGTVQSQVRGTAGRRDDVPQVMASMATEDCTLLGRTSRAERTFSRWFSQGVLGWTQGAQQRERAVVRPGEGRLHEAEGLRRRFDHGRIRRLRVSEPPRKSLQ